MTIPHHFEALINEVNRLNLYHKLIQQLNKDLRLANIDLSFNEAVLPLSLKLLLQETVYSLIHEKFSSYLNLLYIIDVPEHNVKQLDGSDLVKLSETITFLILKREWQKVWFKNR